MYFTTIFVISLFIFTVYGKDLDISEYCNLPCDNGFRNLITHVKCDRLKDKCGPHKRCENFVEVPITEALEKFIVTEHNKYRNKVAMGLENRGTEGAQPSAANMNALRYNKELGNIAQCWANTCQMREHSYCNRASDLPYVGQNMAMRSYSWPEGVNDIEKNLKLMIAAWYDEVQLFSNKFVPRFHFELSYGHYTQMIWGTAEEIGCGISLYTTPGWYNILLICDYGSKKISGNVIDFEMYKIGKPCSQCPQHTHCDLKFKGLCNTKTEYNTNFIGSDITNKINNKIIKESNSTNTFNNSPKYLISLFLFMILIILYVS